MNAFMDPTNCKETLWTDIHLKRTIVLVDMDCFYVQVEQRRDPNLKGKPCAVVQYNDWKGGGIIAVDYIARAHGVSRSMRGDDAAKQCPEIILCRVPVSNGKADLTRYREAGAEVINVLSQFGGCVERASIDEAYIDLSEVVAKKLQDEINAVNLNNTFIEGWTDVADNANAAEIRESGIGKWCQHVNSLEENSCFRRLAIAAAITEDIRAAVFQQTGFRCSAGISHNKMLAKLCCGLHKPNKQTVLPYTSIDNLFNSLKISKIRHLGGKLGVSLCEAFQVKEIGQVRNIPLSMLVDTFGGKTGAWLHEVCHGIDKEEVKERHIPLSIGCGKNFPGQACLNTREKVIMWCEKLMVELSGRLYKDKDANNRIAKTLTTSIKLSTGQSLSRSCPIYSYEIEKLSKDLLSLLQQVNKYDSRNPQWSPAIVSLHVSAKNFNTFGKSKSFSFNTKVESASNTPQTTQPATQRKPQITSTSSAIRETTVDKNMCQIDKALKTYFTQPTNKASTESKPNERPPLNVKKMSASHNVATSLTQPKRNRTKTPTKNEQKEKNSILNFLSPSSRREEIPAKRYKQTNHEHQELTKNMLPQTSSVPLGFFHKKSKFANAVKSALSVDKSEPGTSKITSQHMQTNSCDDKSSSDLIDITNHSETIQSQNFSHPGSSLWSDFSEKESYCEKCDCKIPSWETPEHRSFHLALEAGQIL